MDVLEKMNRRFGAWYERLFGASDGSPELRPREILRRIVAAVEDKRQEGIDGQVYIPNVCTLRLIVEDDEQREFVRAFLNPDELAEKVVEKLTQHSYRLRGGFVLSIEEVAPGEGVPPIAIECKFDASIAPASQIPATPAPKDDAVSETSAGDLGTVPFVGSQSEATLTVIGADGARSVTPIDSSGIIIGRGKSAGNDLILDADPMISKKHLRIILEGGRFLAYDEHSTNGTTVEGTSLTPGHGWPLADGDEIRVGQTRLLFSTDADPKTAPAPRKTPNGQQRDMGVRRAEPVDENEPGAVFRLVSASGERHALASEMLIGRALTDDILVTGEGISAQHARLTVRGVHVYLEDLDTPGGTFVNEERLRPGDARALKAGDQIRIGTVPLTLESDQ
ncbi:MAG: FHA domain-containing protein [Armatimonas sp.]